MASENPSIWEYPLFNAGQEIVGLNALTKALPLLYGPKWESTVYNPLFSNIRTGALMSKPHHCTYNDTKGHATTRRCFTDGHQGYCMEWTDEGGRRVRCGMRFKVESNGCSKHRPNTLKHSINLQIKNMIAGKRSSISWGELNDPERPIESEASTSQAANEVTEAILDKQNQQFEAMDAIGALPVGAHSAYEAYTVFNDKKKTQDREQRERRKTEAEVRRALAAGRGSTVAATNEEFLSPMPQHPKRTEIEKKRRFGKSFFKTTKKSVQNADKWTSKRGGKNALDSSVKE